MSSMLCWLKVHNVADKANGLPREAYLIVSCLISGDALLSPFRCCWEKTMSGSGNSADPLADRLTINTGNPLPNVEHPEHLAISTYGETGLTGRLTGVNKVDRWMNTGPADRRPRILSRFISNPSLESPHLGYTDRGGAKKNGRERSERGVGGLIIQSR